MKKILTLFSAFTLAFSLASCNNNSGNGGENPGGETSLTVTPNSFVATREDTREAVYTHYSYDGEEIESYTSLYKAINACVNEGDTEDYIKQKGSEEKIFINYEEYSTETFDMYWYYKNGNELGEYTYWKDSYWTDVKNTNDICVFKAASNGTVSHYANGYKAVALNTQNPILFRLGTVMNFQTCWELEANATVDLAAYSGITKVQYTLDLSEATITPAYDGGDQAYAYVGFITSDSNNVSNMGLKCDTSTGNWYYYSGETSWNSSSIVMEDEDCYLTSTWDEANQCFRPDGDVDMTLEILRLKDEDDEEYLVHRLTMDFGNDRVVVKDYEISNLTSCGTIRFTCGLDIESDETLVDYMCGAKFENVVVTNALVTVYEENLDDITYTGGTEINRNTYNTKVPAGEWDNLNSNYESPARFHTIIYTPSCVTYDFNTPGKDVYGFTFDLMPAK